MDVRPWSVCNERVMCPQIHIRPCTLCSLDRRGDPCCWRHPEVAGVQGDGERRKASVSPLTHENWIECTWMTVRFLLSELSSLLFCTSYFTDIILNIYPTCCCCLSVTLGLFTSLSPAPQPSQAISIQKEPRRTSMCKSNNSKHWQLVSWGVYLMCSQQVLLNASSPYLP